MSTVRTKNTSKASKVFGRQKRVIMRTVAGGQQSCLSTSPQGAALPHKAWRHLIHI